MRRIRVRPSELRFEAHRASGPGGQNVNKVSTAIRLRFDVAASPSLPADVKERLIRLAGRRMTGQGELTIEAARYRTQEANRRDAERRFLRLLEAAARTPRPRRPTKPTAASRRRRLEAKRRRSEIKRRRRPATDAE